MTPPATVQLCARVRYGSACLGRMHGGVCGKCGDKNAGLTYVRLGGGDRNEQGGKE